MPRWILTLPLLLFPPGVLPAPARAPERQPAADELEAVPRAARPYVATWPSIETVRTWVEYDVSASSFDDALAACRAKGEEGWPGFTEWDLVWTYDYSDYKFDTRPVGDKQLLAVRDIEVRVTSVKVIQKTHLPRLTELEGFTAEDRRRWRQWYADLVRHEVAHQRVSSAAAIEPWLRRRAECVRYLETTFPAGQELGQREAKATIHTELSQLWNHAVARIRDKNEELDQRTAHGPVGFDWDEFLQGYF